MNLFSTLVERLEYLTNGFCACGLASDSSKWLDDAAKPSTIDEKLPAAGLYLLKKD